MENFTLTIALAAVVIEVFGFALALALANEFFAALYEVAPTRYPARPATDTRCARCGARFTNEVDAVYCGFCAVVVIYEHHAYITNLLTPNPNCVRGASNVRARH